MGFCGDRNMESGYIWSAIPSSRIFYAGYERLLRNEYRVIPTFNCNNNNDLYTVSNSSRGNKSLQYPIGLITADEVSFAGISINANTANNYLYTGQYYWTMTPSYADDNAYPIVFGVSNDGILSRWSTNSIFGLRPVINLNANVTISSGDGTSSNPYTIAT